MLLWLKLYLHIQNGNFFITFSLLNIFQEKKKNVCSNMWFNWICIMVWLVLQLNCCHSNFFSLDGFDYFYLISNSYCPMFVSLLCYRVWIFCQRTIRIWNSEFHRWGAKTVKPCVPPSIPLSSHHFLFIRLFL